ncbi:MAG: imidazole glycerol phosphate synthase subunit HisF [Mariniphaga sp.]|nr:imidazole glycerol phosphate synthase subunit HisF [Mariniphaga sp.]
MLAKRIIPCLDIRNGQTVKGINFINIREVGDPVELGAKYAADGADELCFLDITATHEGRKTFVELVKRIASEINIPFTVGGGISELSDAEKLLSAGADKISINSSAVRNPQLIDDLALNFGSQFVVVAIDARGDENNYWTVTVNGGRIPTEKKLFSWAKEAEDRGAGEILFTSMNHDGTKNGFANLQLAQMSESLKIPIIASGGAGKMEDFIDVFTVGKADAGLAASIFHFNEIPIPRLKQFLHSKGITVRL